MEILNRQTLIDLYLHAYMQAVPGSDIENAYLIVASMLIEGQSIEACIPLLERITLLQTKKEEARG